MGIKQSLGRMAATKSTSVAPGLTSGFVQRSLRSAIDGIGPLPGAAEAAAKFLENADGDVEAAVKRAIRDHAGYAGAQGFVTNIGGLVTLAVTIPTNITGLAVIQARLIAVIAHLRGYDLADPRTRDAILACLLGPDTLKRASKKGTVPAPPMAIATAPQHDPTLAATLSNEVANDLIQRVIGKRMAVTVGRRVPVLGGAVGMGADGYATWTLGRFAAKELRARRKD